MKGKKSWLNNGRSNIDQQDLEFLDAGMMTLYIRSIQKL